MTLRGAATAAVAALVGFHHVRRRFASRLPRPHCIRPGENLRCALPGKRPRSTRSGENLRCTLPGKRVPLLYPPCPVEYTLRYSTGQGGYTATSAIAALVG